MKCLKQSIILIRHVFTTKETSLRCQKYLAGKAKEKQTQHLHTASYLGLYLWNNISFSNVGVGMVFQNMANFAW